MALAGARRVLEEEGDSADEGSRDIQVLEAEQKPMMSLSCQNLVTGNSNPLGVLEPSWLVCCSGRWVCISGSVLPLHCSSDPQTADGLCKFYGSIC